MPATGWPEILLPCKHGHDSPSEAGPSSKVDCRVCKTGACAECGPEGKRVALWVPKNRPRTERATRGRAAVPAGAPGPDPALTARWEREPAWSGKIGMVRGRPGDECPECGTALMWEPGRTLIYCTECPQVSLPPAVAEHYERQERRTAEVATRAAPDTAARRSARVQLRALKTRMIERVESWLDALDPDELSGPVERLARDYQAELDGYLPEIKNAASEAELREIMAELTEVVARAESSGVLDAIERHRQAVERQADEDERQAELAEREAREQARQAELERAQRARGAARPQPRAIAPRPSPAQLQGTAGAVGSVIAMIEQSRRNKAARLNKYGQCDFPHRNPVPAERLYGIQTVNQWQGTGTGYQIPGSPQYRACGKHFTDASNAINSIGYREPAVCYWELKA